MWAAAEAEAAAAMVFPITEHRGLSVRGATAAADLKYPIRKQRGIYPALFYPLPTAAAVNATANKKH